MFNKLLAGNHPIREYSTVTIAGDIQEHVYLSIGKLMLDISRNHWLLCLEPVVFGVWLTQKEALAILKEKGGYRMYFAGETAGHARTTGEPGNTDDRRNDDRRNDDRRDKDRRDDDRRDDDRPADFGQRRLKKHAEAIADLEYLDWIEEDGGCLFLLKLTYTNIRHVNPVKSLLFFFKYYKKPGLTYAKYKSFIAAFCYPRQVRLVSFREEDYYTIFPMDLVGEIGWGKRFVFGLRHTNVALARIIAAEKLVVADVSCEQKDFIYGLGKHHSSAPPPLSLLPYGVFQSTGLGFYLPEWIESYKEIRILKAMNLGSHMLLWGEWTNDTIVRKSSRHLFHIHFLHWLHQERRGLGYPSV